MIICLIYIKCQEIECKNSENALYSWMLYSWKFKRYSVYNDRKMRKGEKPHIWAENALDKWLEESVNYKLDDFIFDQH